MSCSSRSTVLRSKQEAQQHGLTDSYVVFDLQKLRGRLEKGSARRVSPSSDELYPEEALYLLERGSCFCEDPDGNSISVAYLFHSLFSDSKSCFGLRFAVTDESSFINYLTYAYLRRCGYSVKRSLDIPCKLWKADWSATSITHQLNVISLQGVSEVPPESFGAVVSLVSDGEVVFIEFKLYDTTPLVQF